MRREITKRRKELMGLALVLLFNFFFNLSAFSQSTTYGRAIGGEGIESGRDMVICPNGDYLVIGVNTSYSAAGDSDLYVVRIKPSDGSEIWHKSIGGPNADMGYSISATTDGNYIIAGSTTSLGAGLEDMYIVKINNNGVVLWSKTYGNAGIDVAREIRTTSDGGYIVTGYSTGNGGPIFHAVLLKLDANGNQLWTKTYGTSQYESGFSVVEAPGGGYVMFGQTYRTGNFDFYLVKTTSTGDTVWTKSFGGSGLEEGQNIQLTGDGGYIVVGDQEKPSKAGDFDVNVTKLDVNGNQTWTKSIGGSDKDVVKMIQSTNDGGYVIAAISRSPEVLHVPPLDPQPDFWIIKTNANADTTWTRHYGGKEHEHCYAVKQTADGGYIAAGHSDSFQSCQTCSVNINLYIVKTDEKGVAGVAYHEKENKNLILFPNPTNGLVTIQLKDGLSNNSMIKITNAAGQLIMEEKINRHEGMYQKSIDLSSYGKGMYFINVNAANEQISKKILIF